MQSHPLRRMHMYMRFWGGCDLWWVQVSHPDEGLLSGYGHDPQTLEVYRIEPVHGIQAQRTRVVLLRPVEYSDKNPLDSDWCRKIRKVGEERRVFISCHVRFVRTTICLLLCQMLKGSYVPNGCDLIVHC